MHGHQRRVAVSWPTARLRMLAPLIMVLLAAAPGGAAAHAPCTATESVSKGLGEKTTKQLPTGPLYWRLEAFASKAAAEGAAGATAIPFEAGGKSWLATLAARGGATAGGTVIAEIGPLANPQAADYRLRVQERVSQPGCEGDIHTHPGAEAWYMLAGEQMVISAQGEQRITAGQGLVGPPSGTPMQLAYRGTGDSDALTFLLLDAAQPNSLPTTFPPGMPNTGAGGARPRADLPMALLAALGGTLLVAGLLAALRGKSARCQRPE